jgi:hypothetical protein
VRIRKKIEICGIVGILDWNRAIKHGNSGNFFNVKLPTPATLSLLFIQNLIDAVILMKKLNERINYNTESGKMITHVGPIGLSDGRG